MEKRKRIPTSCWRSVRLRRSLDAQDRDAGLEAISSRLLGVFIGKKTSLETLWSPFSDKAGMEGLERDEHRSCCGTSLHRRRQTFLDGPFPATCMSTSTLERYCCLLSYPASAIRTRRSTTVRRPLPCSDLRDDHFGLPWDRKQRFLDRIHLIPSHRIPFQDITIISTCL